MPTVSIPSYLQSKLENKKEISFKEGYIYEILENLIEMNIELREILLDNDNKLRRYIKIFINGKDIRFLDDEKSFVKINDQVTILTAVAGG